jgi:aminoglycoside phosphotransferase family enzyme/predicted kinase
VSDASVHDELHLAMMRPGFFAPATAEVTCIATPCSTIYLAGEIAVKVKKPVNLGYLDFSTLAARRAAADAEITLNADLAPGVYRRVAAITRGPGGAFALDGEGEVVNHAVVMRRLPAAGMLSAILRERDLSEDELEALVSRLAAFHARAARSPEVAALGSPDAVLSELRQNLGEARAFAGEAVEVPHIWSHRMARTLLAWMEDQVHQHHALIAARAAGGRVVDGHGDLHAGNICFDPAARDAANPEGLVIYDRLEFRADFRARDVAGEMGCLAASLDASGRRGLGDELLRRYARATGDPDMLTLAPLWRAHYALVRAKVHALRAAQVTGQPAEDESLLATERAALAAGHALGPGVVLMCGLPGSGKSFIARRIAAATGAEWLRADEIRKGLAGVRLTDRLAPEAYTPAAAQSVYDELARRARGALAGGRSVILDATLRSPEARAATLASVARVGMRVLIVHCHAGEEETRSRLARRAGEGRDPSDATFAVYRSMRDEFIPPTASEGEVVSAGPDEAPQRIVARVVHSLCPD